MSTNRARQRWEIRARRPAKDVIAYFEDALTKALDERIDGVEIERRALGTGRTIGVRADGFVIMFALAPVRGGHPFRRSLQRRGVIDLTGTLIVSSDAADTMVLAGDRPGRMQRAVRRLHRTNEAVVVVFATLIIAIGLVSPWLCLPLSVALIIWSSSEDEDPLALPENEFELEPESDAEITAMHLWAVLCDDVGELVSSINLVPALIDGDQPGSP